MAWDIVEIGGVSYYEFSVLLPVDAASTGAGVIYLRPAGGAAGQNIPAIEQGDPGLPADIDTTIVITDVLDYDDSTPDSAFWTQVTPPSPPDPGVYQLNTTVRSGPAGADGVAAMDVDSVDGAKGIGKLIRVNTAQDAFEYFYEKVASRYYPATINNVAQGNTTYTMATVSIPAQNFDWRPRVSGYTIVTATGANVLVNLVARLNTEVSGDIIGFCAGIAATATGSKDRLVLSQGPAAGAAATVDKVAAGATATVYFRTEQPSGSDSYTASNTTSMFSVEVMPIA